MLTAISTAKGISFDNPIGLNASAFKPAWFFREQTARRPASESFALCLYLAPVGRVGKIPGTRKLCKEMHIVSDAPVQGTINLICRTSTVDVYTCRTSKTFAAKFQPILAKRLAGGRDARSSHRRFIFEYSTTTRQSWIAGLSSWRKSCIMWVRITSTYCPSFASQPSGYSLVSSWKSFALFVVRY